jgi:hypothetical protein
MPKVGPKKFAYTRKGERQAAAYANRTGQKMVVARKTPKK